MGKLAIALGLGGLLIAFGPLLLSLLSFQLSNLFGCMDGGANPPVCAVGGEAMGEALWMMALLHWFTLLTILPGLIISLAGLVLGVIAFLHRKRVGFEVS